MPRLQSAKEQKHNEHFICIIIQYGKDIWQEKVEKNLLESGQAGMAGKWQFAEFRKRLKLMRSRLAAARPLPFLLQPF